MAVDQARLAALDLLREVREDDAYANLAMPAILARRRLTGRDAAFATELGYGTLRWQGWYDAILARCVDRALDAVQPVLLDILRLGSHQLLAMRVPAHAAVASSVDLARDAGDPRDSDKSGGKGRAGFVNAVLRKVSAHDAAGWAHELGIDTDDSAGIDVDALATRTSHPRWIVRAFADALGSRRTELPALLAADNEPARPSLVARPGQISVEELRALPGVEPGRWSPFAATLTNGAPDALDAVRDGRVGVQDEGSQLVALALTRAQVDGPESAWLDLCAGPGGKAAILAGIAAERGIDFVGVEQHAHRARLVEQSIGSLPNTTVVTGDARSAPWTNSAPWAGAARGRAPQFDRVMLDAPCTGLGALRRRPEARWRRQPGDVPMLGALQRALIDAAIDATRPGGVIAYVTCSPHLAETQVVVDDAVRRRGDVVLEDARPLLPELDDLGTGPNDTGPTVQLWPHRHGTDAMFLAVLRKQ